MLCIINIPNDDDEKKEEKKERSCRKLKTESS